MRIAVLDRARDDRGTSLPELLVTMMIFGIVIAATASLTIGFQRANGQNLSRQTQIDDARAAVAAMSLTLGSAVKPSQLPACAGAGGCPGEAFILASDYSVRFYANLNNPGNIVGPSRIEYTVVTTGVNAGRLMESIQIPDKNVPGLSGTYEYCDAKAAGASTACKARLTERPIAFHADISAGAPLFKYFNQAGTRMTPPAGGSLATTDMSHMLSIELDVRSKTVTATSGDTQVVQRVTLPNAAALIRQNELGSTP